MRSTTSSLSIEVEPTRPTKAPSSFELVGLYSFLPFSFAYMQNYLYLWVSSNKGKNSMKGQPQTTYQMTVTWVDGDQRAAHSGSLRSVLEYLANHVPLEMDSYHKVWRELARTGGAYSSFFPAVPMPMQVVILEKKLIKPEPVRELQKDVDTYQRGQYEKAQDEYASTVYQHPSFYSGFAVEPTPAPAPVTVECANCSTLVQVVDGQGHCPYCVDMFTEKPSPVTFPSHSHPTLTWDKMSKWQRKNYVIKS